MKEFWDERYSDEDYYYGQKPNDFFKIFIDNNPSGKILLPSEGEGRNAVYAALKGWSCNAFDFSVTAQKKAMTLAKKHSVEINYYLSDLEDFKIEENQYDAVALIFVHMKADIRKEFHSKIVESLKSGGKIVLEAFSKEQLAYNSGGPKDIDLLYSIKDIEDDFSNLGFFEIKKHEIRLNEGKNHKGVGSVIDFIAVKR